MSAFTIKDLEYRYTKSSPLALQGINIDVEAGQCLGLIGPNGAGKSTLLSILSGLITCYSGTLCFKQSDNLSLRQFIQKNVALVPQEYAFYPQLSVAQNLEYFVSLCGIKQTKCQSRIDKVTEQCQLQQVYNKPAKILSGGYKRRLNLAIALLKDPQILYLDEPTVGVDPITREALLTQLNSLKKHGKTIVYTSHLLAEVQDISDQIVMLNHGKASYLNLQHGSKCLSLEFAEIPAADWIAQLSNIPIKVAPSGKQFELYIETPAILQQVLTLLGHSQHKIVNLHYDQTSLTQYYVSHMEQDDNSEH
ncbi:ABC transporter ATP-binding protein [uncultured Paraglaciecola sp.]|uniref:ABC transporter ATP-binding protein n=1 Tax=uncultured Paraglaciecola sp. TaxID=1765024 RepID=UPI00260ECB7F|nr:ABC transporter ATP-binding protein [uncultured Paraglaciecola sp.]